MSKIIYTCGITNKDWNTRHSQRSDITTVKGENWFLRRQTIFMYSTNMHKAYKQVYSIYVVLKFHEAGDDYKKS